MAEKNTALPVTPKDQVRIPGYLRISKIAAYVLYAWTIFGVILLGTRIFLLAFSANATTPFVEFIYRTSADYLAPFREIFPPKTLGETGYFDVAALFAIFMYLLFMWGASALIHYIQRKIDDDTANQEERYRLLAEHQAPRASSTPRKSSRAVQQ